MHGKWRATKGLELSQKALELEANVSDKLLLAHSYQNIGAAKKALDKYDEALASFDEAQKNFMTPTQIRRCATSHFAQSPSVTPTT